MGEDSSVVQCKEFMGLGGGGEESPPTAGAEGRGHKVLLLKLVGGGVTLTAHGVGTEASGLGASPSLL